MEFPKGGGRIKIAVECGPYLGPAFIRTTIWKPETCQGVFRGRGGIRNGNTRGIYTLFVGRCANAYGASSSLSVKARVRLGSYQQKGSGFVVEAWL